MRIALLQLDPIVGALDRNVDAILDLLLLALSENLYVFELKPNRLGAKYSGFSVLASNLKGSRPILERLISALA